LISSAACGITSKPMKKNGVTTATLMMFWNIVPVLSPTNICPCRLLESPLITDATIRRIPAPPMIQVRTVCRTAAVFAPSTLISVMRNATITATATQEA